tara:strand:- start:67 stop:336 length:270 start_codon:yes stop_codon:yes gene_type:complete
MVMRLNQSELQRTLQDRAGAFGGSARKSHTPQISTSPPSPNDDASDDSGRFAIHLFDDPSSNSVRLIELDDTLLTGRLDDDIEILGLCG